MPCRTALNLEQLGDRVVLSATPADPIVVDPPSPGGPPVVTQPVNPTPGPVVTAPVVENYEYATAEAAYDWDALFAELDAPAGEGEGGTIPIAAPAAPPVGASTAVLIGFYEQVETNLKAQIAGLDVQIAVQNITIATLKETLTTLKGQEATAYKDHLNAVEAFNKVVAILQAAKDPRTAPTANDYAWAKQALPGVQEALDQSRGVMKGFRESIATVKTQAETAKTAKDKLVRDRDLLNAQLVTVQLQLALLRLQLQQQAGGV